MAGAAIQRKAPRASRSLRGATASSANTSRSSTMLVSITTGRTALPCGDSGAIDSPCRRAPRTGTYGAAHHVEAEQAAFNGTVPHRHAARLLQAHLAGQLEVGREHPGRPACIVFLPVCGQLAKELAPVIGVRSLAAHRSALGAHRGALAGVKTMQA